MMLDKNGEIQASKCFVDDSGNMHDFFKKVLKLGNSEGGKCLWKVTELTVKKVMLGDNTFLVPTIMLDQVPDGYLIQEMAVLVRVRLGREGAPVFFKNDTYDLLMNNKVLDSIKRSGKKIKFFGVYVDEQKKRLHYVSEIILTFDELIYSWNTWENILRDYPLFVISSDTMGSFTMTLNEEHFSIVKTREEPSLGFLAKAVKKTLHDGLS